MADAVIETTETPAIPTPTPVETPPPAAPPKRGIERMETAVKKIVQERNNPTPAAPAAAQVEAPSTSEVEAPEVKAEVAPTTTTTEAVPAPQGTTETETVEAKLARLEKENVDLKRQQDRIQDRNQTQQLQAAMSRAEVEFNQSIAPQVQVLNDLHGEYQQAIEDGELEAANRIAQRWNVLNESVKTQERQFGQQQQVFQRQFHQQRYTEHEKTVDNFLTKHGLSLKEVKEAGGEKFDPTNGFAVLDKALELATKRHKAELKASKDAVSEAEKKAREKWGNTSPASRVTDTTQPGGSPNTGKAMTATERLERGIANALANRK